MSLLSVASGDIASGGDVPEGVSFDGKIDYLSRSTDLVGNVDSKTFTFSVWVYASEYEPNGTNIYITYNSTNWKFVVYIHSDKSIRILGQNTAGTIILNVTTSAAFSLNTWNNILISMDLSNTSNRAIYFNDILLTATWTTYNNDSIDFTQNIHRVVDNVAGAKLKGRLSNVFLSYDYIDLSIVENRRIFINEDGTAVT